MYRTEQTALWNSRQQPRQLQADSTNYYSFKQLLTHHSSTASHTALNRQQHSRPSVEQTAAQLEQNSSSVEWHSTAHKQLQTVWCRADTFKYQTNKICRMSRQHSTASQQNSINSYSFISNNYSFS